jgi:aspartyl-tRNA(Asn)/glutamyl-tRNA(Gln) amidotransferase subunit A
MTPEPWLRDACALVDAFRSGELSPGEAVDATLHSIASSDLNAFSHVDGDAARRTAETADVNLPFGGVPVAIKELEAVAGWPYTQASLIFRDDVADVDSTQVARLRAADAVV